MNAKQFNLRVLAVEKKLIDLERSLPASAFKNATDEELESLIKLREAYRKSGDWGSISTDTKNNAELAIMRMRKRAKDRSRPHSRKLLAYFPPPTIIL